MKFIITSVLLLMILGVLTIFINQSVEPLVSQNDVRKNKKLLGEYVGYSFGKTLLSDKELNLDIRDVIEGLKKIDEGKQIGIDEDKYHQLLIDSEEDFSKQIAMDNLVKANSFLNKIKHSVDVAEVEKDKLYFRIMVTGEGRRIQQSGKGSFHIKCCTVNGDEVVNTYAKKKPLVQNLPEAIIGFAKGVSGMQEGEKRILYIHPDLAYGFFNIFEPNMLLITEVELFKILN